MTKVASTASKAVVKEVFGKVLNGKSLDAASHYLTDNVEIQLVHKHLTGIKEWKKMAEKVGRAFPDLHYELSDLVMEGDHIACRFEAKGTQKGELFGHAPTNKRCQWNGLALFEVESEKIRRGWIYSNLSAVFQA